MEVAVFRHDLLGSYIGTTRGKTLMTLIMNKGNTLIIEEPICVNADTDSFGVEAVQTIKNYLLQFPDEIDIMYHGTKLTSENIDSFWVNAVW